MSGMYTIKRDGTVCPYLHAVTVEFAAAIDDGGPGLTAIITLITETGLKRVFVLTEPDIKRLTELLGNKK